MRRGEVWLISLDPTIGSELQKTRPAVIVSDDAIGVLPLKVIAPITAWKDRYAVAPWMVRLEPDADNGLNKSSASARSRCAACLKCDSCGGSAGCPRRPCDRSPLRSQWS